MRFTAEINFQLLKRKVPISGSQMGSQMVLIGFTDFTDGSQMSWVGFTDLWFKYEYEWVHR